MSRPTFPECPHTFQLPTFPVASVPFFFLDQSALVHRFSSPRGGA